MLENLDFKISLTVCEVLLGITYDREKEFEILNMIMLLGKWFLNQCKMKEQPIYFLNFLSLLKSKTECLIYTSTFKGENHDWYNLLQSVL